MKFVAIVLLTIGLSSFALAGIFTVPEIGPTSGVTALAMVSGALLVIRGRRKKHPTEVR